MIDEYLENFLNAQSGVTSIVSDRIYPVILPKKPTYPAITFRDDDHDIDETFSGNHTLTRSDYFIDAWSKTHTGAIALEAAIRTALKNHSGSFGGINIQRLSIRTIPGMIYEDSVEAYRKTQLFTIWHDEG